MKRNLITGGMCLAILAGSRYLHFEKTRGVVEAATVMAPRFEVDPLWPQPLPNHWVLGPTVGVAVDSKDHVWIVHRAGMNDPSEMFLSTNKAECCTPAPLVLEFLPDGSLGRHWGGPHEGYDYPAENHGIFIDYKDNVWIGGAGRGVDPDAKPGSPPVRLKAGDNDLVGYFHDANLVKFTEDGKFLMQIGKAGVVKGSNDTETLRLPAKSFVDPKTDEVYVADGYANHRVVVFDANTGKYKRHWGAYGHKPEDKSLGPYDPSAPVAQQFRTPVHCAMLSSDNLLYVCDRVNDRIQVFRPDGTFVKEAFIAKNTLGQGSVWDIAFSKDPQQKYLYVPDGASNKVRIILRDTLEVVTSFGDGGRQPGEFFGVHSIAVDSKGNIYTTETFEGHRLQKFIYKGLAPVTKLDQGVVWPKITMK
jgi:hypothetical protein